MKLIPRTFQLRVDKVTKLVRTVRLANVLIACTQFSAGVSCLTQVFALDVTGFLIAVFAILFALLLLCFECHLNVTDNIMRPNFGFLYGYRGMANYLVFIGLLDIGMVGHILGTIAGISACLNACFVVFVGICAPRTSSEYPAVVSNNAMASYGSSAQLQGPITFALASGAMKIGSTQAVHAIV